MATEQHKPDSLVLSDGSLKYTITHNDKESQEGSIDLLILKLCCERCEEEHKLPVVDGTIPPTPEFLIDLAARLSICGVEHCTPSMAWQLWHTSIKQMEILKKTMNSTPSLPTGLASTLEPLPEKKSSDTPPT